MRNTILVATLFLFDAAGAAQVETFDYYAANRELIRRGVQAVLTCNGLFTSERTVEQVFAQELAYTDPGARHVLGLRKLRYPPRRVRNEAGAR